MTGQAKRSLCDDILAAATNDAAQHVAEYEYYPNDWFEPYQQRRRENGFSLYEKLGIERNDATARQQQILRNYQFFDAPVGLLISLDRRLNTGSYYMDLACSSRTSCSPPEARVYIPAPKPHSPGTTR